MIQDQLGFTTFELREPRDGRYRESVSRQLRTSPFGARYAPEQVPTQNHCVLALFRLFRTIFPPSLTRNELRGDLQSRLAKISGFWTSGPLDYLITSNVCHLRWGTRPSSWQTPGASTKLRRSFRVGCLASFRIISGK